MVHTFCVDSCFGPYFLDTPILVPTVISLTEIVYVADKVYCTIVVTLDADVANKIIRKFFIWYLKKATLAF